MISAPTEVLSHDAGPLDFATAKTQSAHRAKGRDIPSPYQPAESIG